MRTRRFLLLGILLITLTAIGAWTDALLFAQPAQVAPPPPGSSIRVARPNAARSMVVPLEPLPPGVQDSVILTNMAYPVALAIGDDGRIFYTEKNSGRVRVIVNGQLQTTPVIQVQVNNSDDLGLMGITFDPDYATNHYMYIWYTGVNPVSNRVARFEEYDGVGSNRVIVFVSPYQTSSQNWHIGGNLHFGPDGKLYLSIGDNNIPSYPQQLNDPRGKMHRFDADTVPLSAPPDNPFYGQSGVVQSIWTWGLRNTFDFDFDPVVSTPDFVSMWASENGPDVHDELNVMQTPGGGNYGWPICIGPCDPPDPLYVDPVYTWSPTIAVTAVKFYPPWGNIVDWRNDLFVCSFNTRELHHLELDETRTTVVSEAIVEDVNCTLDFEVAPDGSVYYIEGGGYFPGTLHRLWTSATPAPTATPTNIPAISPTPSPIPPTATATPVTPTRTPTLTHTPTVTPGPYDVAIGDFFFAPQDYIISVGETVLWRNIGALAHTTTSVSGLWDSGLLSYNQDFSFTFTAPGDYFYFCAPHPWMTGSIHVLGPVFTLTPLPTDVPTYTPTPNPTSTATRTPTATPTPAWTHTVSIQRMGQHAFLTWASDSQALAYRIYRGTSPYFAPPYGSPYAQTPRTSFIDLYALANPAVNYTYVVTALYATGAEAPYDNRVGEFDFALADSPDSLSDLAIPLDVSAVITDAQSLGNWIDPAHISQLLKWDATLGLFLAWSVQGGFGENFGVQTGDFIYLIGDNGLIPVASFVGVIPPPGSVHFRLTLGAANDCSMNLLSLPLDRSDLTTADELSDDIGGVVQALDWDAALQMFLVWSNIGGFGENFETRIGHPYTVCLDNTAPGVWP